MGQAFVGLGQSFVEKIDAMQPPGIGTIAEQFQEDAT